jgi:rare lipoprotein A (peptidoglycan hydrolase)
MRWEYHVEHMTPEEVKRWWANKKLQITNPRNEVSIVARAVDWGPHEKTGLDVGVSPGAADALGVEVGDEVQIELADPKSPLGVVS